MGKEKGFIEFGIDDCQHWVDPENQVELDMASDGDPSSSSDNYMKFNDETDETDDLKFGKPLLDSGTTFALLPKKMLK
jgi:hypothetical protein